MDVKVAVEPETKEEARDAGAGVGGAPAAEAGEGAAKEKEVDAGGDPRDVGGDDAAGDEYEAPDYGGDDDEPPEVPGAGKDEEDDDEKELKAYHEWKTASRGKAYGKGEYQTGKSSGKPKGKGKKGDGKTKGSKGKAEKGKANKGKGKAKAQEEEAWHPEHEPLPMDEAWTLMNEFDANFQTEDSDGASWGGYLAYCTRQSNNGEAHVTRLARAIVTVSKWYGAENLGRIISRMPILPRDREDYDPTTSKASCPICKRWVSCNSCGMEKHMGSDHCISAWEHMPNWEKRDYVICSQCLVETTLKDFRNHHLYGTCRGCWADGGIKEKSKKFIWSGDDNVEQPVLWVTRVKLFNSYEEPSAKQHYVAKQTPRMTVGKVKRPRTMEVMKPYKRKWPSIHEPEPDEEQKRIWRKDGRSRSPRRESPGPTRRRLRSPAPEKSSRARGSADVRGGSACDHLRKEVKLYSAEGRPTRRVTVKDDELIEFMAQQEAEKEIKMAEAVAKRKKEIMEEYEAKKKAKVVEEHDRRRVAKTPPKKAVAAPHKKKEEKAPPPPPSRHSAKEVPKASGSTRAGRDDKKEPEKESSESSYEEDSESESVEEVKPTKKKPTPAPPKAKAPAQAKSAGTAEPRPKTPAELQQELAETQRRLEALQQQMSSRSAPFPAQPMQPSWWPGYGPGPFYG